MNKKIFYLYFYILYFIFIFIFIFTFIVDSNNAEFGDSIVDENASITEYWYEEYQL